MFNYHQAKLAFGLILFEFDDAIKEGDGERIHDIYKVALLLYKAHGKTKYAYAILLYLTKIEAILSESDAHNLKWNRTFNKHGLPGMNIPLDLRTEQYNCAVKSMWRSLGSNFNEDSALYLFIYLFCFAWELRIYIKKNIDDNYKTRQGHHNSKNQLLWAQLRVANTVEPMEGILDAIRRDCGLPEIQGYRSAGNSEVPVLQVIRDLVEINAFKYEAGREGHPSFAKFPSSLLRNLDYRDLHTWMNDLLKTWETIYELNRV